MARPILYQPRQRWRIAVALGTAALFPFAAVALASMRQHEQIEEVPSLPPGIPEVLIEPASPIDDSIRPLDEAAPTPNPNPTDKSFPDERPSPPPIRRQDNRLVAPIVKARNGTPGSLTLSSAKVLALSAPRPEYPYEARRQRITGDGIAVMTVDPVTGSVTDVSMWKSTGNPYLDNAAVTGFRRWRFKPGTVSRVKTPITYTLTGAAY
jgi:periplasmic protein TonB